MKPVILDTGPLVAWFCPRDEHHLWARKVFPGFASGSVLCEAMLTEVCHLVAKEGVAPGRVMDSLNRGRFRHVALGNELGTITRLLHAYSDAPMDFADACVVRLAEMFPNTAVCTTDTQFRFFRVNERDTIPLLASFAG